MGEMIFEGRVDEAEVGRIAVGMDLILSVGAIEAKTFNAEQHFERREVRTGLSDGINIKIVDGLSEGEKIKKL